MKNISTPEGLVLNAILKYLSSKGIFHFRVYNGAVWDARLGQYRAYVGMKGVTDIICVIKGRFHGIEVKRKKGGKQSSEQFIFQQRLEEAGGVYILARSVEDVAKKLSTHMC